MTRLLLIAVAGYLLTGLAVVGPDERAVVRRFGRVVARPGPGLWVGLPWGIDRVDRLPVRAVRQLPVGAAADDEAAGLFLTGDGNLVAVGLVVEFAPDPSDAGLDDYLLHRDRADAALAREAEAVAADWLAGRGVDEALLAGRAALPAVLLAELPGRLAGHRLGVAVRRASVERLAAPAAVREAFDGVSRAQAGIATAENRAAEEAARTLEAATTLRTQLGARAAADRTAVVSAAGADADRFRRRLAAYRQAREKDPNVLAGLWWAEMGATLRGLRAGGRVDLLDHHLGADGLDLTQFARPSSPAPKR